MRTPWTGKPFIGSRMTRRIEDGYLYDKSEDFELYFGAYFFASEEVVEQSRSVNGVIDVLGQVGGIYGIVSALVGLLIRYINRRFSLIKFQNEMFFCPDDTSLNKDDALLKLNFKFMCKGISNCFRKREKSDTEMFIEKQLDMALDEMNFLRLVNTVSKLKAGMIALFDDQKKEKVALAKHIFLSGRMVPLIKRESYNHHNEFTDFLNTYYLKTGPNGESNEQFVHQEYLKLHTSFMLKNILGLKFGQ